MKITDRQIIEACENSLTMSEACSKTGLHFNTFMGRSKLLGVYKPNKGGKGLKKSKKIGEDNFSIENILNGSHPQYQSHKLRIRLIREGYKEEKCENCEIKEWNNKRLPFELDHIDGNKHNHLLVNLRILCPNCHSQTKTFRSKNIKK